MSWLDRLRGPSVRVHVLIKGRIGEGWLDVDENLRVPPGTTLEKFVERCAVAENATRVLADGDELYLLAPLAGG